MTYFPRIAVTALALVLCICASVFGSKLILNDGTVIEGTVIKTGDDYWVKTADGTSRTIAASDVKQMIVESPGSSSGSPTASSEPSDSSAAFRTAKNRANTIPSALGAVAIWQEFIDKNSNSPDLDQAKLEMAKWKSLADSGAERINGKWVGGEERQKIIEDAAALTHDALAMMDNDADPQTLAALDKLQQSEKLYPNSYLTNFCLGYLKMFQKDYNASAEFYHTAALLKPTAVEAVNNLAVANFFAERYETAIFGFQKALEMQDSEPVAENLYTALADAPKEITEQPKMKSVEEASNLLATKYSIAGISKKFALMHPPEGKTAPKGAQHPPSMVWSGSGFFIDDSGLILTNKHVAKGAKTILVMTLTGQASADVIAIDDQYDLALIRMKTKDKTPFMHFSPIDLPSDGADCVVMGFPLMDRLGADIKITRGIVSSSSSDAGQGADMLTDAKVNPGNSGGPIVDKFGNVMGIVCMKSVASAMEDSYGIGISAGHIREFLQRNNVNVTPGATAKVLSTEDIVTQDKPMAVCILATQ